MLVYQRVQRKTVPGWSTPQNKAFSNQNKGHLGSRYIYIYVDVMQTIPYIRENESGMIQAKPLPWHKSGGRVGPLHAFVVRQPWGICFDFLL